MKRFTINWAIPGLLAMIVIIFAVAWAQTQSAAAPEPDKLANQCSACHGMDTHVSNWQTSTHKNVACTDCHADPGVRGWVEMQLGKARMQWRKDEVDISKIATQVPNERCIACHAREMPWVMQDLKPAKLDEKGEPIRVSKEKLEFLPAVAGHDLHLTMEKPLSCTSCHSGVSHGPEAEDRPAQIERMHNLCLDCHAQEKVAVDVRNTISCSACHLETRNILPEDHKSTAFRTTHGKDALKDVTSCQACHLNPGIVGELKDGAHTLKVADAKTKSQTTPHFPAGSLQLPAGVQVQDNCASCHGVTMPHPQQWLSTHAQGFNEKPELCASCHGDRAAGLNAITKVAPKDLPTQSASCTGCHAQPMPHPAGWMPGNHGDAAKAAPQTCQQCHSPANPANPNAAHASPKFCLECHLSGQFRHPSGYVAQHSVDLSRYGNNQSAAGCTQCHTPTENSCTACHTGGVSSKQQWHPANWVGAHKDTLAKFTGNQVTAGCTQCHTSADPKAPITACTTCHTAGVGKQTQWHPDNWWIGHARTTKPSDVASCTSCHAYVQPSCSQCHTKY